MQLFSWLLHAYHYPTCERAPAHVRDTCMKFLGMNKCKFYKLVACRTCYRINHVSFSSTIVITFSGKKKKEDHKLKLLGLDIFQWGGHLPCEGVGAKKFGMSLEPQEPDFGAGHPGISPRITGG